MVLPLNATNLRILRSLLAGNGPLELYVRKGDFPDRNTYDKFAIIGSAGGIMSLGLNDSPPLSPGERYFIGLFNASASPQRVRIQVRFDLDLKPRELPSF